jgi:hypothetical protein
MPRSPRSWQMVAAHVEHNAEQVRQCHDGNPREASRMYRPPQNRTVTRGVHASRWVQPSRVVVAMASLLSDWDSLVTGVVLPVG